MLCVVFFGPNGWRFSGWPPPFYQLSFYPRLYKRNLTPFRRSIGQSAATAGWAWPQLDQMHVVYLPFSFIIFSITITLKARLPSHYFGILEAAPIYVR
jgi:hypothetical protein